MANHYYFDIKLKLRDPDAVVLTPALFRSCVLEALDSFFCEEKPTLEIVKFCAQQQRVVFRVPEELHDIVRMSIELIGHYQQMPCHFEILQSSKSSLDFEKSIEKTLSGLPNFED
ncbi:uncharacterized protein LOC6538834 [Drosophila yakuba]|uniref:Uncharacterized protein n=1 Tax=Drosophila yakuba TaxID=7245 RepID=B4PLS2_DROYA|nr:uncharacterized protein LOC6538834 [Drosophila yakuba]XP_039494298.1 uncharacterized protein LOC120453599 [Drosophila santomea]EDW99059.1 uncharacterized protein Dyak_GE10856 [Drosophila yakuba]